MYIIIISVDLDYETSFNLDQKWTLSEGFWYHTSYRDGKGNKGLDKHFSVSRPLFVSSSEDENVGAPI